MRQFYDLLVANLKMTVRNKQALFWLFVFPLILMGLFGIVFNGGQATPRLGIVDRDNTPESHKILEGFEKAKIIKLYEVSELKDAKKRLKAGNLDGVVVLPTGFSKDLKQAIVENDERRARQMASENPGSVESPSKVKVDLYYDPSATFVSQVVRGSVANVLGSVDRAVSRSPTLLGLKSHSVRLTNLRYIDFLVPGIIAMTLMNSAMFGLAGTIVNYRERGILRGLKVTPQPLALFLAAQITNQMLFSILRALLLIGAAWLFFDVHVLGSYFALFVVIIIGSLAFVTIAFSVASFSRNREISDTLSNIITMPMMFLGGVFFPVDTAPAWIRPLIKALPLTYLANAMRDVMIKAEPLSAISYDLWVLVATTVVFFIISFKLWRWE